MTLEHDALKIVCGTSTSRAGTLSKLLWVVFSLCLTLFAHALDSDKMLQQYRARYGEAAVEKFQAWRNLLASLHGKNEFAQLQAVNDFFNRKIYFADDSQIWGQEDYWATPLQTLAKGMGDCEDFAVAKYFSLRELGIPLERLRLVYVRAKIGGPQSSITQAHMVLSYYPKPEDEPWILDNLIGEMRLASRRPDLLPVFSFNGEGIWPAGQKQATSPVDRINRWRELILRMQDESYDVR